MSQRSIRRFASRSHSDSSKNRYSPERRLLRFEGLESRWVLATFTVNSIGDHAPDACDGPGNDPPEDPPFSFPGECTLRDAISAANEDVEDADTIVFHDQLRDVFGEEDAIYEHQSSLEPALGAGFRFVAAVITIGWNNQALPYIIGPVNINGALGLGRVFVLGSCTLTSLPPSPNSPAGFGIQSGQVAITDIGVGGFRDGIHVFSGTGIQLTNNIIGNNGFSGVTNFLPNWEPSDLTNCGHGVEVGSEPVPHVPAGFPGAPLDLLNVTVSGSTISGNWSNGIQVRNDGALTNVNIQNNGIGVRPGDAIPVLIAPGAPWGNVHNGINVMGEAVQINITGNLIAANGWHGVKVEDVPFVPHLFPRNVTIGGPDANRNFIGIANGFNSVGNFRSGVYIRGGQNTVVENNQIVFNHEHGVRIQGALGGGPVVLRDNAIQANAGDGVRVVGGDAQSVDFAGGNVIAVNVSDGVAIVDGAMGVHIDGALERIFDNGGLGIDLEDDGVTNNDVDDADEGSNLLQNYPELSADIAPFAGGQTVTAVSGVLDSRPNEWYEIDLFRDNTSAFELSDPRGHGEGRFHLAKLWVFTDANGIATFNQPLTPGTVMRPAVVTATATRLFTSDTSEFARNVPLQNRPPRIEWLSVVPTGNGLTLQAEGVTDADDLPPNSDVASVSFYADADGNNNLDIAVDTFVDSVANPVGSASIPYSGSANTFFAQALDDSGALSNVVIGRRPPTVNLHVNSVHQVNQQIKVNYSVAGGPVPDPFRIAVMASLTTDGSTQDDQIRPRTLGFLTVAAGQETGNYLSDPIDVGGGAMLDMVDSFIVAIIDALQTVDELDESDNHGRLVDAFLDSSNETLYVHGGEGSDQITVVLEPVTDDYVARLNNSVIGRVDSGLGVTRIHVRGYTGEDSIDPRQIYDPLRPTIQIESGVTLLGGTGDDVLYGTVFFNFLDGGQDDDLLVSGTGPDTLVGRTGNDTYRFSGPSFGNDFVGELEHTHTVLNGEEGADRLDFSMAGFSVGTGIPFSLASTSSQPAFGVPGTSLTLATDASIEQILGSPNDDFIQGNSAANLLDGGGGSDSLYGADGDDTIIGGAGHDQIYGQAGSNTYRYIGVGLGFDAITPDNPWEDRIDFSQAGFPVGSPAGLPFWLGSGEFQDVFNGQLSLYIDGTVAEVIGSPFNDHIRGSHLTTMIDGGLGNDVIQSGDSSELLIGGLGADVFRFWGYSLGADQVSGGVNSGEDTLDFSQADFSAGAPAAAPLSLQTASTQDVFGGLEHLTLSLSDPSKIGKVIGSPQADYLLGSAAGDQLEGGGGNDRLEGDGGNDTLTGGGGNDNLNGGGGLDVYRFWGSSLGTDQVTAGGNAAEDTLDFLQASFSVGSPAGTAFVLQGGSQNVFSGNLVLSLVDPANVGRVVGSGFGDYLVGSAASDTFEGSGGNDRLEGVGGHDTLLGGSGNDTLEGHTGDDRLEGGNNNDTYRFQAAGLGTDTIVESTLSLGGIDTLDFTNAPYPVGTSTTPFDLKLATTQNAFNGAANLQIKLNTGSTVENVNTSASVAPTYDDKIIGGTNANSIVTHGGNDTVDGGGGNDRLEGGAGNDSLKGGAGNDVFVFTGAGGLGADVIDEPQNQGVDQLDFSGATFSVGQPGTALALNNNGIQSVFGGAGVLTLQLIAAGTTSPGTIENVLGGIADDHISGNDLPNMFVGGLGHDRLTGLVGDDTLEGGGGDDSLFGGEGSDTYAFKNANLGSDIVTESGAVGIDALDFAQATFGVGISTSTPFQIGLAGLHDVFGGAAFLRLTMAAANSIEKLVAAISPYSDFIQGTAAADVIYGGAGDDWIDGQAGNDSIYGGDGGDTLYGQDGNDLFDAGEGPDTVHAGAGDDDLRGYGGNDFLYGNDGADYFHGGDGDDFIDGAIGGDTAQGGAGTDTVLGYDGDDVLYGDDGADYVNGGAGNDFVSGDYGGDTLHGEGGDDSLRGGAGDDYLYGGDDNDTYVFAALPYGGSLGADIVDEQTATGTDTLDFAGFGAAATISLNRGDEQNVDIPTSGALLRLTLLNYGKLENVIGSAFGDDITGNLLANTLRGGNGQDVIRGGAGNDLIFGGLLNDFLYGNDGDDDMDGEEGDDDVGIGGLGEDENIGGRIEDWTD